MVSLMKKYEEKRWLESLAGQPLDDMEIKYLQLKGQGKRRPEIIKELNLGAEYMERRLRKILLAKLQVNTVLDAVVKAYANKLVIFENY